MTRELHTLDNGVTVIVDPIPHVKTASVGFYFTVGSRLETPANNGTAHFLEHMAFKGTSTRDALQISRDLEDRGAMTNAFTGHEQTCYFLYGLDRDTSHFVELLGDILENSTLPTDEVDCERGTILQEIGMHNDQPMNVAFENAIAKAFPRQPLGASVIGPADNIRNMDQQTLQDFRSAHYHGGNLIVSVSGNVDSKQILNDVRHATANLADHNASQFDLPAYHGGASHEERSTDQLNCVMAFNAAAANTNESSAEKVLGIILGGGMSSRLFQEAREKRGLVYSIRSSAMAELDHGLFVIKAQTGEDEAAQLMPVICDEVRRIQNEHVSDEELARARAKVQAAIAREEEYVQERMVDAASEFQKHGRLHTQQEILDAIDTVTKQDIQDAARRIFASEPTISTVGPGRNMPRYDQIRQDLRP